MDDETLDVEISRILGKLNYLPNMFGGVIEMASTSDSPLKLNAKAFELIVEYNLDITPKRDIDTGSTIWEVYCGGNKGSSESLNRACCLAVYYEHRDKE